MAPFASRRASRALYVEIDIAAPIELVWQLTQDPAQHTRWDARFSRIIPTTLREDGAQQFRYELDALPLVTIRGTGVSAGERFGAAGSRTSALTFESDGWFSPLRSGRGYWRYVPTAEGVRFITGYDYTPGFGAVGRVLDRLIVRRMVWWITAWSFDRLRQWAEAGTVPERIGPLRGWFGGPRARASACRSAPEGRTTRPSMREAPELLARLDDDQGAAHD